MASSDVRASLSQPSIGGATVIGTGLPQGNATPSRQWMPEQVLFTPAALEESWGQQILTRVERLGLPVKPLAQNRVTGLRGKTERETYRMAKQTLAVVVAPPGQLKLSPIPPSADWQFHLAQGCPAHCQYCYLAGSLQGPPVVRAYANLPQILDNLRHYRSTERITTFEVSCYTDPLGIEHLTGSLAECIRYFGTQDGAHLRWVSKFDQVEALVGLPHNGRTRCRFSVNARAVSHFLEGGTADVVQRLRALRKLALPPSQGGGGYPVGLVIAPIMPLDHWQQEYGTLFNQIEDALDFDCDLTFELISHRFTPKSKAVLEQWYPNSRLNLDESDRSVKRNKFGGIKHVYNSKTMRSLKAFFESEISRRFPQAKLLYWT
ncbi:MAG: spore photoproduct lyase family protein [Elainellaceae cyanobacterium]